MTETAIDTLAAQCLIMTQMINVANDNGIEQGLHALASSPVEGMVSHPNENSKVPQGVFRRFLRRLWGV